MKTLQILCLFLMLALVACKSQPQQPVPSVEPKDEETLEGENPTPSVTPSGDACKAIREGQMPESNAVMGFKASIKDKCMVLNLTYSGGCQDHDFELYWNGAWAESVPPQTHLYLYHNAKEDKCRELTMRKVNFDLKNMTYPGLNTVQMTIHAGELDPVVLTYTYE